MKQRLVVFGMGDIAELADYYFSRDSNYEVVAFTVDSPYLKEPSFCGKPVVAFEEIQRIHPPASHAFFAALSYSQLNGLRTQKYLAGKSLGYSLASYVSSRASVIRVL